jgi:hypothetical protein
LRSNDIQKKLTEYDRIKYAQGATSRLLGLVITGSFGPALEMDIADKQAKITLPSGVHLTRDASGDWTSDSSSETDDPVDEVVGIIHRLQAAFRPNFSEGIWDNIQDQVGGFLARAEQESKDTNS